MSVHDTVVLGGGPAGCATAIALGQHGYSNTLVVESSRYDVTRIGESIPPDTRLLLQQLGVWDEFLSEEHEPCLGSCSSWGDDELGYNDFVFNPLGHGWHLDRARFDGFLARRAEACGADVRTGTTFVAAERTRPEGFRLTLAGDDGHSRTVSARFVVDATGHRATFARRMGARKRVLDRLTCVAGVFDGTASTRQSRLTMLEAVEYGWWYAARLPGDRLAAAVACDPEFMKESALSTSGSWRAHLAETCHLSSALGGCVFVEGSLAVCTAPSFLLDTVAGDGWIAVGDAASAHDPISSQGIYSALSSGLQAADVVAALLKGETAAHRDYQAFVGGRFDDYVEIRNYLYGMEQRWAGAPFWKRRLERTAL